MLKPYAFVMLAKVSFGSPEVRILQTLRAQGTIRNLTLAVFCCFINQLVKKLQQWPLFQSIDDILSFVLNTKLLLSDIWLLKYEQNSFGMDMVGLGFRIFLIGRTGLYTGGPKSIPLPANPECTLMSIISNFL